MNLEDFEGLHITCASGFVYFFFSYHMYIWFCIFFFILLPPFTQKKRLAKKKTERELSERPLEDRNLQLNPRILVEYEN